MPKSSKKYFAYVIDFFDDKNLPLTHLFRGSRLWSRFLGCSDAFLANSTADLTSPLQRSDLGRADELSVASEERRVTGSDMYVN
jgi:hypothetical protein